MKLKIPLTCSDALINSWGTFTSQALVVHPTYPKCMIREQGTDDMKTAAVVVSACQGSCIRVPDFQDALAARNLELDTIWLYEKCGPNHSCRLRLSQWLGKPIHIETLPNVGRCDHTYANFIFSQYTMLADVTFFVKDTYALSKWSQVDHTMTDLASQLAVFGFGCGSTLYVDTSDVLNRYLPKGIYSSGSDAHSKVGLNMTEAFFRGNTSTWEAFQLQLNLPPHDDTARGTLHVDIQSACGLNSRFLRGTTWLNIALYDARYETSTREGDLCPKWNERYSFQGIVSDILGGSLRFSILNDDDADGDDNSEQINSEQISYSLAPLRTSFSAEISLALPNELSGVLNFTVTLEHLHPTCYGGDFVVQRHLLQAHPRRTYERMTALLARGDNIMEGHLVERTWARMFTQLFRDYCPAEGNVKGVIGRCSACKFGAKKSDFCHPEDAHTISGCKLVG